MTGSLVKKTSSSGKTYFYIQLSYKNQLGKWQKKTVSTKLEVKGNKKKAESLINSYIEKYAYLEDHSFSKDTFNPDITLCEYIDTWIHSKELEIKQSTFEIYTYRVELIKKYFKGKNPKLIDISSRTLDNYFKYLLRYGKTNQKTGEAEPMSVRSVREYKNILYSLFNQAVIDGLVRINPATGIKISGKKNRDYSETYLFLTEEEISDLLHFLSIHYPRLLGIAFMGAYYGLRCSEIIGLKWSAIDFKRKLISIKHTVVHSKSIIASDSTKTTSSRRELDLFPTAEFCLKKIQKEQLENKSFFQSEYQNTNGYIFTWENGKPYRPDYISKLFHKATIEFGRPEITLHKLRHSCASMLISKGWDIKKVQYWLGHSDVQTTLNIYAHFNRQQLNSNSNDLNEISKTSKDLFI